MTYLSDQCDDINDEQSINWIVSKVSNEVIKKQVNPYTGGL